MLLYLLLCSLKIKNDVSLLSLPTSSTAMSQELQTVNPLWSDFKSCTLVFSQTSEVYYAILVLIYEGCCYQRLCMKKSQCRSNTILLKSWVLLTVNQPQLPEMLRKSLITLMKNSSHCCHLLNSYGYWSHICIFYYSSILVFFVSTTRFCACGHKIISITNHF